MTPSPMSGAEDERARLEHLLREQGVEAGEMADQVDLLTDLACWTAPVPTEAATAHLIRQLQPLVPTRQSRARPVTLAGEWRSLLSLVAAQVSILRPAFWLTSAVVMLLGVVAVLSLAMPAAFAFSVSGPLLSYIGTASAFRGTTLKTLEFELACPPSARQLTLARLVLILGYDIGLILLGSSLLRLWGGGAPMALTLQWLAPLLLVTGLTLLLSLRLPVATAAALSYVAWLIFLVSRWLQSGPNGAVPLDAAMLVGAAGLALLVAAVSAAPAVSGRLLPHA